MEYLMGQTSIKIIKLISMGIVLEQLIQRHGFYVITYLDHTYEHSPNCYNSG